MNKIDEIKIAQDLLNQWEVIAFATETVYWIGCRIDKIEVVEKIFDLKQRENNPLQVLFANKDIIYKYSVVETDLEKKIIDEFMPWPITLLLKTNWKIDKSILCGSPFVWVRIPDNDLLLDVLAWIDFPICATSANLSWKEPCLNAEAVKNIFWDKIPFVLDGWECCEKISSTVLVVKNWEINILREWPVSKNDILEKVRLEKYE